MAPLQVWSVREQDQWEVEARAELGAVPKGSIDWWRGETKNIMEHGIARTRK